jgi:HSP20 family molecular chaperone IbpA
MKFNRSKFIIALVCVSVGWTVGYYMGRTSGLKMARNSLFSIGPFSMDWPQSMFSLDFDSNKSKDFNFFGFSNNSDSFSTREDNNFVYYEFDAADMDKDSLNVKVENGMIIVEGEKTSNSFGGSFKSKIYKTFPIPQEVNEKDMQMYNEGTKIIVKLPKHGV